MRILGTYGVLSEYTFFAIIVRLYYISPNWYYVCAPHNLGFVIQRTLIHSNSCVKAYNHRQPVMPTYSSIMKHVIWVSVAVDVLFCLYYSKTMVIDSTCYRYRWSRGCPNTVSLKLSAVNKLCRHIVVVLAIEVARTLSIVDSTFVVGKTLR